MAGKTQGRWRIYLHIGRLFYLLKYEKDNVGDGIVTFNQFSTFVRSHYYT